MFVKLRNFVNARINSIRQAQNTLEPKPYVSSLALLAVCTMIIATYWLAYKEFSPNSFRVAALSLDPYPTLGLFAVAFAITYILFGSVLKIALSHLSKKFVVFIVATTFIVIAVIAIQTLPYRSQDIYHDLILIKGNVELGLNPYLTTPNDLLSQPWIKHISVWQDFPIIYGPIWVYFLGIIFHIFHSLINILIAIKVFFLLILVICATLTAKIAKLLKFSETNIIFILGIFLFNPIVVQSFLVDIHSDVFICLSILFSYYLFLKKKYIASIFSLLGGGLVKYVSLLLIPIPASRLIYDKKWKGIYLLILAGVISIIATLIVYYPFGLNLKTLGGLGMQLNLVKSTDMGTIGSVLLIYLTQNYALVRLIGLCATFASTFFYYKSNSPLRYVLPFLVLLFIGTPWFMTWYLLWIIPLSLLAFPWWIIATSTIMMTVLQEPMLLTTPEATVILSIFILGGVVIQKSIPVLRQTIHRLL